MSSGRIQAISPLAAARISVWGLRFARAEAQIALPLLFERFSSLHLDPDRPIEHKHVPVFNGLKALWVRTG